MIAANVSYSDPSQDPSAVDLKSRSLPFFALFREGKDGPEVRLFKVMDKESWANVTDNELKVRIEKDANSPDMVMSRADFLSAFKPIGGQESGVIGAYVRETKPLKAVEMSTDFYVDYDGHLEKGKAGQMLLRDSSGINRVINKDSPDYKPANEPDPVLTVTVRPPSKDLDKTASSEYGM